VSAGVASVREAQVMMRGQRRLMWSAVPHKLPYRSSYFFNRIDRLVRAHRRAASPADQKKGFKIQSAKECPSVINLITA
jgi:hypothetical protein